MNSGDKPWFDEYVLHGNINNNLPHKISLVLLFIGGSIIKLIAIEFPSKINKLQKREKKSVRIIFYSILSENECD